MKTILQLAIALLLSACSYAPSGTYVAVDEQGQVVMGANGLPRTILTIDGQQAVAHADGISKLWDARYVDHMLILQDVAGAEVALRVDADELRGTGTNPIRFKKSITVDAIPPTGLLGHAITAAAQDDAIRSQVNEGVALADGAKTAVAEFYSNSGRFPSDNASAGIAASTSIVGTYVGDLKIEDGSIYVTYSSQYPQRADAALTGKMLKLVPVASQNGTSWTCQSNIDLKYLPLPCRKMQAVLDTNAPTTAGLPNRLQVPPSIAVSDVAPVQPSSESSTDALARQPNTPWKSNDVASGPSFDCSRASYPTEVAICGNTELGRLDRQMATLYLVRSSNKTDLAMRAQQRQWIQERNQKCGSDVNCLREQINDRIKQLQ